LKDWLRWRPAGATPYFHDYLFYKKGMVFYMVALSLELMLLGLGGVFISLTILCLSVKLLVKIFPSDD